MVEHNGPSDPYIDKLMADAWYGTRSVRLLQSYLGEVGAIEVAAAGLRSAIKALLDDSAVDKRGFAESEADDEVWRRLLAAQHDIIEARAKVNRWHQANRRPGA